jgi:hypothetical protein
MLIHSHGKFPDKNFIYFVTCEIDKRVKKRKKFIAITIYPDCKLFLHCLPISYIMKEIEFDLDNLYDYRTSALQPLLHMVTYF